MKRTTKILWILGMLSGLVHAEMKSSVSQWGITWNFDKAYECGQFVNGDWYVVGPVTVQAVTPSPGGGRHGSMINPVTGTQAYDNRIQAYSADLSVSFPVVLQADQSLVSSISLLESDCNCTASSGPGTRSLSGACIPYKDNRPQLKTAAVLTCLKSTPPSDAFRPGFNGDNKKIRTASQLRRDLLPALTPPSTTPDFTYYERGLERPWLQHITDWTCRELHPIENMHNYHREIYGFLMDVCLILLLDRPDKETLLIRFVQQGIDQYNMILLGHGDSAAEMWTVLFAGLMLDEPEIYNVIRENRHRTRFRPEWQAYYAEDAQSTILSSIVPAGQCRTGYLVPSTGRQPGRVVMWRKDPGCKEHEHLDRSEWGLVCEGGGIKNEAYRVAAPPSWPGMALAARLFKAESLFTHDAFFDYADRWMTEDGNANSNFATRMWQLYRNTVPLGVSTPDFVHRTGERISAALTPNPIRAGQRVTAGALSRAESWSVELYDHTGAPVARYSFRSRAASFAWPANLTAGIYFYCLRTGASSRYGKIAVTGE